ncbi:MAG: hypothetical protein QGH45_03300 [Myxococcota bacterium]|nr:hypothetical protein [Myxococcota bacterium]
MRTPKPWLTLVLAALWLLAGPGCPTAEDDDAGDDDDSGADDDTGDDDDTGGDDDTGDDDNGDDDDTGDDDDSGAPPCADQGGITLTLDTSQTINSCGAPWSELDVAMVLRDSTVCSGCAGEAASGEVWVYPAELFLDFSDLDCEVTRAIVQVIDYVGGGAAQVRLYDASGALIDSNTNAQVAVEESIPVGYLGGPPAAGAGVDGCETMVTLIQLL